ncbi:MAG: hypothetical protein JWO31_3842 [Phycisphaerales bacterium]|nr:hypothetical protein [Phycisphaerales bacterium]
MKPLRLLIVATAMVAVLALVAGFAAENEQNREDKRTATETVVAPAPAPTRVINADVPRAKPIVARVGQSVQLTVKLAEDDTLIIDAFGLDEGIAANIPTPILFTAISPGRYDLKLQNSGKVIGQLVVKPARPVSESGGTSPTPQPESPSVAEPASAA